MKFEAGTKYRLRGGGVIRLIRVHHDKQWPFLVAAWVETPDGEPAEPNQKITFCPGGNYFPQSGPDETKSPLDIVGTAS